MESFNLEYYRAFYTVAQTGNVTKAAELLCLSQPAVTRSIHRLEESLGCKLFIRVSRGVRLTVEGTALFSHVDSAFKSLSNGERELKRLAAFEAGTPIIGAAEMPLYHFLLRRHLPGGELLWYLLAILLEVAYLLLTALPLTGGIFLDPRDAAAMATIPY